jgi:hypothetical protein
MLNLFQHLMFHKEVQDTFLPGVWGYPPASKKPPRLGVDKDHFYCHCERSAAISGV